MIYWLEMQSELSGEWVRKGAVEKKRENERRMKWREMCREREGGK